MRVELLIFGAVLFGLGLLTLAASFENPCRPASQLCNPVVSNNPFTSCSYCSNSYSYYLATAILAITGLVL